MAKVFASARMDRDRRACESELAELRAGAPVRAAEALNTRTPAGVHGGA
jgi:hypothetical protein